MGCGSGATMHGLHAPGHTVPMIKPYPLLLLQMIDASPVRRLYFRKSGRMKLESDVQIQTTNLEEVSIVDSAHTCNTCVCGCHIKGGRPAAAFSANACCILTLSQALVLGHLFEPEEAHSLASFLIPLLAWDPLVRPEPGQLLAHPWLAVPESASKKAAERGRLEAERQQRGRHGWWRPSWLGGRGPSLSGGGGGDVEAVAAAAGPAFPDVFSDDLDE